MVRGICIGGSVVTDPAANPVRATEASVTILVIDDDADLRGYIRDCLRRDGQPRPTVMEAASGLEALELLEHTSPDLVITDAVMPGMDGFTLARTIRLQAPEHDVPILLVTGQLPWREASARAREVGAQALLPKPFNARKLCETVARLLTDRPRPDDLSPDEAQASHTQAVHPKPKDGHNGPDV